MQNRPIFRFQFTVLLSHHIIVKKHREGENIYFFFPAHYCSLSEIIYCSPRKLIKIYP